MTTASIWLKRQNKRKNRRATKDVIKKERFDEIPPKKFIRVEDRWRWF